LILILVCLPLSGAEDNAETTDLQDEYFRLMFDKTTENYEQNQERLLKLRGDLQRFAKREERLSGDAEYVSRRMARTLDSLSRVDEELSSLQFEKAELDRSLASANNELNRMRSVFNRRLKDWYMDGMGGYLTLLPTEGDDIDLLVKLYFAENVLENDRRLLMEITQAHSRIEDMSDRQNEKIAEINRTQLEYKTLQNQLSRQKTEIAEQIAINDQREKRAIRELEIIEEQSGRIEDFLKSLKAGDIPEIDFNGTFSLPLSKSDYRISDKFGMRHHPIHRVWKMHTGQDLGAPKGTPIYAAASGVVKMVRNLRSGYGKYLVIYHSDKYSTLYAHCSEILVSEGDPVMEGQVIAKVGSTGTARGNHLHFEIRTDTRPADPRRFVKF
jgi:murein DD-endopeptidase MepM/ murein hydrolase activator NlpD